MRFTTKIKESRGACGRQQKGITITEGGEGRDMRECNWRGVLDGREGSEYKHDQEFALAMRMMREIWGQGQFRDRGK